MVSWKTLGNGFLVIMSQYRRLWCPGGTYFFTVNLSQRGDNDLLLRHINELRSVVANVKRRHPFVIHAWVVLPDHMHCVIELPHGDADFATRWRLIKAGFSRLLSKTEYCPLNRKRRGERGIWQRRFWEHLIRDESDYRMHVDYVHINPLKHGLVECLKEWPYSTFHKWVKAGVYPIDWAG